MRIIFHNDDYGLNNAFTEGILSAHKNGVTTSTSIRTNGTDYLNSVKKIKFQKKLGLGLHVNLTDGKEYNYTFVTYCLKLLLKDKEVIDFVKSDLENQFKQAIQNDKLTIDHVNSQDHVHMIPPIFEIVCQLCQKWDINYIRIVNEPRFTLNFKSILNGNLLKNLILNYFAKQDIAIAHKYKLKHVDLFYGTLFTDNMDVNVIKSIVLDAKKRKVKTIEILSHPTVKPKKTTRYTSEFLRSYTHKPNRQVELQALLSNDLKNFLSKHDILLTNYSNLQNGK